MLRVAERTPRTPLSPRSRPLLAGVLAAAARLGGASSALALAGLLGVSAGCSAQTYVSLLPGVINDPSNLSLRREILGFGTGEMCREAAKQSVPLRFRNDDPALGRFFPRQCAVRELDNGHLYVHVAGTGYAWSNVTKRVGFGASAGIEYAPDFRFDGSTMYVYFRPVSTTEQRFDVTLVEQGGGGTALGMLLPGGDPKGFVTQVGESLLTNELGRGFTVIRESGGETSFGLGLIPPGQRASQAFERSSGGRKVLANEHIEIHQEQRDYTGPFEVPSDGMALFLTMHVEGTSGVDVQIHPRPTGEVWLQSYTTSTPAGPPPTSPLLDESVTAGMMWRRVIRLPKGSYFVVVDHSSTAGPSSPPKLALDDRAASIRLGVEVDAAP
jgi:hypothetical protein